MTSATEQDAGGSPPEGVEVAAVELPPQPLPSAIIPVLQETVSVSKRRVKTATVRVSTRTQTVDEVAEAVLDRGTVEVTRVPVGRVVEVPPDIRVEGETTIVPVLEERLVVIKQLVLVEEVHIHRRVRQEVARQPVSLRRQHAVVERFDPQGRLVIDEAT